MSKFMSIPFMLFSGFAMAQSEPQSTLNNTVSFLIILGVIIVGAVLLGYRAKQRKHLSDLVEKRQQLKTLNDEAARKS